MNLEDQKLRDEALGMGVLSAGGLWKAHEIVTNASRVIVYKETIQKETEERVRTQILEQIVTQIC